MVPAQTASSQTLDGSVRTVQPNDVRKAERHQARPTENDAVGAVAQNADQKPRFADGVKAQNQPRSTAMSRTARAHLESHHQATGLPPTAMICQNCEPEPPRCRLYNCNSPIVDGATIVVARDRSASRQRKETQSER